jgi:crossover junction endodeoxyribonuclease RusA
VRWIELPLPPSANNLFINLRGGGRALAPKYRAWREAAVATIAVTVGGARVAGPYALRIEAGRPDKRRRDLDGLLKGISDALVKGQAVDDDSVCESIEAKWVPGIPGLVRVLVLPAARVA